MGTTVMECPPSQRLFCCPTGEVTRRRPIHPAAIPELSPLLSGLSAFSAVRLLVYAELPRKVRPRRQPLGSLQLGELRASTREEALHLVELEQSSQRGQLANDGSFEASGNGH